MDFMDKNNKTTSDILKRKSTVITPHLKELNETFCSEKRQEVVLAKQLQDLRRRLNIIYRLSLRSMQNLLHLNTTWSHKDPHE